MEVIPEEGGSTTGSEPTGGNSISSWFYPRATHPTPIDWLTGHEFLFTLSKINDPKAGAEYPRFVGCLERWTGFYLSQDIHRPAAAYGPVSRFPCGSSQMLRVIPGCVIPPASIRPGFISLGEFGDVDNICLCELPCLVRQARSLRMNSVS